MKITRDTEALARRTLDQIYNNIETKGPIEPMNDAMFPVPERNPAPDLIALDVARRAGKFA